MDRKNCESLIVLNSSIMIELAFFRQWRHKHMAVRFLVMLIRHDYPFPTVGVELIVNGLIHDALAIRKVN